MFLYDSCFTIIGLVHSALMPEMTESLEERSKLQVSSSLFGLLGTLLGFIIPDLVRPKAGSADTSLWPLRLAMIGLGLVCGLLIWIATYKIKERPEFSQVDKPIPPERSTQSDADQQKLYRLRYRQLYGGLYVLDLHGRDFFTFQTMLPSRIPYTFWARCLFRWRLACR